MTSLDAPHPAFEQVAAERITARMLDGAWRVRVDLPRAGPGATLLRLVFVTGRIGPHALAVSGARALRRVRPGDEGGGTDPADWRPIPGTHTVDAELPAGQHAAVISWIEPAEGARLVRLGAASLLTDELPGDLRDQWIDDANADLEHYRKAVAAVDADSSRSDVQRRAAHFWLALDLTTSLADPETQGEAVARELGIPPELVVVDSVRRKWLTELLETRWRMRACCAAAGLPFDLLMGGVPGEASALAKEVAELVLHLLRRSFGSDLRAAWVHVVAFACGALRRPGAGERLNVEPNSMAMASFAEVVDFAALGEQNRDAVHYAELELLRRMFVSMLEPFREIYVAHDRPRRAVYYRYQNLKRERGPQARGTWSDARLADHVAQVEALSYPELVQTWGDTLAAALADEPAVQRARQYAEQHGGDGAG